MIPFAVYGILLIVGLAGFVYSSGYRYRKIDKQACFVGLSRENHNAVFSLPPEKEFSFDAILPKFANGSDKFFSDPAKIAFAYSNGQPFLQDNNVKNMLTVNRRRVKKAFIKDGDMIELGGVRIMYLNSAIPCKFDGTRSALRNMFGKNIKQNIPVHLPKLVALDNRNKTTVLSKNHMFVGKSETNDIVLKMNDVSFKHAVIKRISGKYKLVDLSSQNGTYVNGRKCDEKFLKNGDEIAFDTAKFKIVFRDLAQKNLL